MCVCVCECCTCDASNAFEVCIRMRELFSFLQMLFPRVLWLMVFQMVDFVFSLQTDATSPDMCFGCSKVMSKCIRFFVVVVSIRMHWIRVREWRKRKVFYLENHHNSPYFFFLIFFVLSFPITNWSGVNVCAQWCLYSTAAANTKVEPKNWMDWKELFSKPNYNIFFVSFCVKRRI